MTPEEKIFLKHVKEKCKEHNVKLVLKNTKKIKIWDKTYVGGYFNGISTTKGELACAAKNSEYLNLLIHEFLAAHANSPLVVDIPLKVN